MNTLSNEARELKSNIAEQLNKTRELGGEVRHVLGGEKGLGETQQLAEHVSQLADKLKSSILSDPVGKVKQLYLAQANAKRIDPEKIIDNRYRDIVNFENYLYDNNVLLYNIFLILFVAPGFA